MDTPTAIQILQALAQQLRGDANGKNAQADSIDIAINQLQGILDTPSVDLVEANETIASLMEEKAILQDRLDASLAQVASVSDIDP